MEVAQAIEPSSLDAYQVDDTLLLGFAFLDCHRSGRPSPTWLSVLCGDVEFLRGEGSYVI